jgi:hypothetical protein
MPVRRYTLYPKKAADVETSALPDPAVVVALLVVGRIKTIKVPWKEN